MMWDKDRGGTKWSHWKEYRSMGTEGERGEIAISSTFNVIPPHPTHLCMHIISFQPNLSTDQIRLKYFQYVTGKILVEVLQRLLYLHAFWQSAIIFQISKQLSVLTLPNLWFPSILTSESTYQRFVLVPGPAETLALWAVYFNRRVNGTVFAAAAWRQFRFGELCQVPPLYQPPLCSVPTQGLPSKTAEGKKSFLYRIRRPGFA